MTGKHYVHGYAHEELQRLDNQARTLTPILHEGTRYEPGELVLEAGCGVGAQTVALSTNSPDAQFLSIDISPDSLALAQQAVRNRGLQNVTFLKADIFQSGLAPQSFDHIFICFVLEHLPNPEEALQVLRGLLKEGGTITLIEGDHGSTFFHPRSDLAWQPIQCLIDLQARLGGDSLIGRRLYPLVRDAGFKDTDVRPLVIYADPGRPDMVEGFTWQTYIAMVRGVRQKAIDSEMISGAEFDAGMAALEQSGRADGTFSYTFFKAIARK